MVEFIKNKFDYRRPMGRLNYFLTSIVYSFIYTFPAIVLSVGLGYFNPNSPPAGILFYYFILGLPMLLLGLRRCKAAAIPNSFIYIALGFSIVNLFTFGSQFSSFTAIYGLILNLFLYFSPNKIEPLNP